MIKVRFEANVQTTYGQSVRIVGNHQKLGDWMPSMGVELFTNKESYPIWCSQAELRFTEGEDLEFKIVVMNSVYQLERWENLYYNRIYTTNICKDQVVLKFTEACPSIEEFYDGPVEKISENTLKNYARIMAPMKIRCTPLLHPKVEEEIDEKYEENLLKKGQENGIIQQQEQQKVEEINDQLQGQSEQKQEHEIHQNGVEITQKQFQYKQQTSSIDYFYKSIAEKSEAVLISTHTKVLRLKNELKQLAKNLPVQSSNSIFLVYDEQRIDVMRALIFGSEGTPYAHGAFIFDIFIPDEYPQFPPKVSIVSTKDNQIRFNPNLYADGLVCLSLLGTWEGEQSENWDPAASNIYQILISIQSLVMNEDVYFNEPYYSEQKGTDHGDKCNRAYSNIVKFYNIQHSICDMIENPPAEFEKVILTHFLIKKEAIKQTAEQWLDEAKKQKDCYYDELIEDHNQQISCRFSGSEEEYHNSLNQEVQRLHLLLDSLQNRINHSSILPS